MKPWSHILRSPHFRAPAVLVAAGVLAYANSLHGVFLFDDLQTLFPKVRIDHLWPPWDWLSTDRPLVFLTLAVNHALGGLEVRGYHILNIGIHLLASLTLYGVVRRTLETEPFRQTVGSSSSVLALWTALLWVVHPLQTQSVTYIIQRGESLMGLFYLLTLYGVARGASSQRRWAWHALSIGACAMGMGAKAVMVTAPVAALLYDRWFLANSFGRALRDRWPLYVGLASTWGVLVACGVLRTVFTASSQYQTVGYGLHGVSSMAYARTQAGVILHYLWLCFYPLQLCLDYAWPIADWKTSIPSLAVIAAAVAATIFFAARRHWVGFASVWFFLVLAPTSSIIPIRDAAFEHRMYLPLAAVIVTAVGGAYTLARKLGESSRLGPRSLLAILQLLGLVVAVTLGGLTVRRNRDYTDALRMWSDVAAKRPENPRGHMTLGVHLQNRGRRNEAVASYGRAIDAYRRIIALEGDYPDAQFNLGIALLRANRGEEAEAAFRQMVLLSPKDPDARLYLGNFLAIRQDFEGAAKEYGEGLQTAPGDAELREKLCTALRMLGRSREAMAECQAAVRLAPNSAAGHEALAHVFVAQGDMAGAILEFQRVVELDAANVSARMHLGTCLKREGRTAEALEQYRRILQLDPTNSEAQIALMDLESARR